MATARPIWLLQANLRDQVFLSQLKIVLSEATTDWIEVALVPFVTELPELPAVCLGRPVICYGPSFVPRVLGHRQLRPGIFFDDDKFRWSTMRAAWGDSMLVPDAEVVALAEAVRLLEAQGGTAFFRPDADNKLFDGAVYNLAGLRTIERSQLPTLSVVMAKPIAIEAEWRCFVVNGQVVDGSEYRRMGKAAFHHGVPQPAISLVEAAAERWLPAPVVCVDVASAGARYGIVEANCFNASRFYAADIANVISVVTNFVATAATQVRIAPTA
jgi:ATP-grasp domain, R2K clade family 3